MQTQLQRRRKDPAETRCKIALLILFLLGAALIAASSFGIFKGIEYDEKHPIVKKDPTGPSSK